MIKKSILTLLPGLFLFLYGVKGYCQTYHEEDWKKVEVYIHKNWHTSKTDSANTSWLRYTGLVPPKPFMAIAKGHSLLFYWDNYFTNKGLLLIDTLGVYAKNGVDNLLWEVDTIGFVPNANINWGMNRSQTPYLALMVYDIYQINKDKVWLKKAYGTLKKEYHFWTDTSICSMENHNTTIRGLQRFYHHASLNELSDLYASCYERGLLQEHPDSVDLDNKLRIAGNFTTEAATGMDFTPRFENRCTDFIAVDLNSNLYRYETLFHWMVKELDLKDEPNWKLQAKKRKTLINKYCWDKEKGTYMDYDFKNKRFSSVSSIACLYPLVMGIATKEQAKKTLKSLHCYEYEYGITICEKKTKPLSYQWDYPAGWPPIYLLTAQALVNYGYKEEACRICSKYLDIVAKNFETPNPNTYKPNGSSTELVREPGAIYEKYNVVTGGINDLEYPANEFFGWSAGVYIWCLDFYRKNN